MRTQIETLIPARLADMSTHVNERFASFMDWQFNKYFLSFSLRWLFTSFWARYGWAYPGLPVSLIAVLAALTGISGIGVFRWTVKVSKHLPMWQQRTLAVFALTGFITVAMAVFRLDPIRLPEQCDPLWARYPSTGYYILPAVMPLMLVWIVGLLAWIPPSKHRYAMAACILFFFTLTMASLILRQIPGYLSFYGIPFEPNAWHVFYP